MELIDTHTHLYLPEFDEDRDEMVNRAVSSGVVKLLMPNIDTDSVDRMLSAADRYKGICYPMIGLHPTSVKEDYREQLDKLESLTHEQDFIAIGEIGIDLYRDKTHFKEQREALKRQIAFAISSSLPVVIHSRESFPELFSVLEEFRGEALKGVMHAFSGNMQNAEKAVGMGFKLGIGGPLTFKNSRLTDITKEIGIEHIILETDSPYLAPVPFRGKRNESSYIGLVNKRLAEVIEMDEKEVARTTFETSCRLFRI
jgi:TatD DNase family protein